jgi:hypothetical protein
MAHINVNPHPRTANQVASVASVPTGVTKNHIHLVYRYNYIRNSLKAARLY